MSSTEAQNSVNLPLYVYHVFMFTNLTLEKKCSNDFGKTLDQAKAWSFSHLQDGSYEGEKGAKAAFQILAKYYLCFHCCSLALILS